jgi:CBS domain-containing protein
MRTGSGAQRGRWQREPLTAQEIMTRNPRTVRRDSPLRDAAQIMKDENVGIVPVVDEGARLVGVLTDRDVVVRAFADERQPTSFRVSDVMTDDVEAVTPEESIHEIIELMGRKQIRRVPVVDREDRLLGIIAMADIANRAEQDEELQAALERISSRRSFWSRSFT